ncbi:ATP-binding protein [Pseudooceanicola sp.]|uniref:ATP-binding protein n=1 Tax=Pseudooceanicola sp. TaxID=1914328 RepID=UPI0035C6B185
MAASGMATSGAPMGQGRLAVRGEPPALVLRADSIAVRQALAQVVAQLADQGLTIEELGSVELVLAEALNNIVEHAYAGEPGGEIQLWWTLSPRGLHVRIADSGREMPDGRMPLNLGKCAADHAAIVPEGGFGWFLIAGLARNIVYRREGGVNILTFRMIVGEPVENFFAASEGDA